MSKLDLPTKKIDIKDDVNCFMAQSDKNVTWLISIHISIRDNIYVELKNLVSFFVFLQFFRVLLGNDAITVYMTSDRNI